MYTYDYYEHLWIIFRLCRQFSRWCSHRLKSWTKSRPSILRLRPIASYHKIDITISMYIIPTVVMMMTECQLLYGIFVYINHFCYRFQTSNQHWFNTICNDLYLMICFCLSFACLIFIQILSSLWCLKAVLTFIATLIQLRKYPVCINCDQCWWYFVLF